jgi:hypothetical protein
VLTNQGSTKHFKSSNPERERERAMDRERKRERARESVAFQISAVGLHAGHEVLQVVLQEAGELSDQRFWVKVPGQLLPKHVIKQSHQPTLKRTPHNR